MDVAAQLDVEITAPTTLEFQIAVAPHPNTEVTESLSFVLTVPRLLPGDQRAPTATESTNRRRGGTLNVDYAATDHRAADPRRSPSTTCRCICGSSRYAEADKFYGLPAEFGAYDPATLVGERVLLGGHPLNHAGLQRSGSTGGRTRCWPGAGCAAPTWWWRCYGRSTPARVGVGVRAGSVADGLPRRRQRRTSTRQWRVVDGDAAGAAPEPGAYATGRDVADTAFPGQPGGDLAGTAGGHRDRGRRPARDLVDHIWCRSAERRAAATADERLVVAAQLAPACEHVRMIRARRAARTVTCSRSPRWCWPVAAPGGRDARLAVSPLPPAPPVQGPCQTDGGDDLPKRCSAASSAFPSTTPIRTAPVWRPWPCCGSRPPARIGSLVINLGGRAAPASTWP